ncbi:MAG: hypothetical protein JW770_01195 [Actinobacteria bacterium]|nr:hypothetical protein [Actinomycetota bacterium]
MKRIIVFGTIICAATIAMVSMAGCLGERIAESITEKAIEKAIENESDGEVDIDISEGEMKIEGDEGEVSISSSEEGVSIKSDEGEATYGASAELPATFPQSIPVYPDMEIHSSFESTGDGGKSSWSVGGLTSDPGEDVFNWYKEQMSGWEQEGEFTAQNEGETTMTFGASNESFTVSIMVFESESGEVNIIQNIEEK